MKKLIVIAPTHRQFYDFLRLHNINPARAVFANTWRSVRGYRDAEWTLAGEFWKVHELPELETYLRYTHGNPKIFREPADKP